MESMSDSLRMSKATHFQWADLLAGGLCAVVTLAYASGFGTLIFGGVLAPYSGQAVLAAIICSVIALLALSVRSSFSFAMGGPDSNPSAVLAITAATLAAEFPADLGHAAALPTVLMYLFASAIGCGAILFAFGKLGWGRYVQYVPHPVIGGFLAGTGYLLTAGGIRMLIRDTSGSAHVEGMLSVPVLAWTTAGTVLALLLILTRVRKHYAIVPGVVVAGVLGFHLVLAISGTSLASARSAGLLLHPLSLSEWSTPLSIPWENVQWGSLFAHLGDFAGVTAVALITILLNATGLDVTTGQDADFDRELKTLGIANVVGGAAGGFVVVNSFNRSLLNLRAGAASPWAARICAVVIAVVAIFSPASVSLLPRPVLAGLILFLGASLLLTWLWDSRRTLPLGDYLTVLAMLLIVVFAGIAPGVVLGIVISGLSFVVAFSRNSAVKDQFTGLSRRSVVQRPADEANRLRSRGDRLKGFKLHGYLFFGTANGVMERVREELPTADVVLVDFWDVKGMDASAVMILRKLLRVAKETGVQMVFTGMTPELQTRMRTCGLDLSGQPVRCFPDMDHGLEWSEQLLLEEGSAEATLAEALEGFEPDEAELIGQYFEQQVIDAGAFVLRKGEPSDEFYVIIRGRLSIYMTIPGADYRKRLRSYGPGTIVGEMGFFSGEPRSADISADCETILCSISRERFQVLDAIRPDLAGKLCRIILNTLSNRLRDANEQLCQSL